MRGCRTPSAFPDVRTAADCRTRRALSIRGATLTASFAGGCRDRRDALNKQVNTRFRVQFKDTEDPWLHHKAAIPQILQPYPSPGTPASPLTGLQYDSMY